MDTSLPKDFTLLLQRHQNGERDLREQILTAIYGELRRLAAHYMAGERADHTLQPTALVHEAWMRLDAQGTWAKNRAHFKALAAGIMKEVLVDHARKKLALKRGGGFGEVTLLLEEEMGFPSAQPSEMIELCDSLERLRELDQRQAQLVELRVFGGMSFEEAAEELGVSLATVKRDWLLARAWLVRELR